MVAVRILPETEGPVVLVDTSAVAVAVAGDLKTVTIPAQVVQAVRPGC